jgi:hypothetical protein
MGLSPGFYGQATRFGYRGYCLPINAKTGNPDGVCIRSTEWMAKYHYSRQQIRTLLRQKRIKGFKFKNTLYLQDIQPDDY